MKEYNDSLPEEETCWLKLGNMRIRQISSSVFAVNEIYRIGTGFMCYGYRIDLSVYTDMKIKAYEKNCEQYRALLPDDRYFAAVSIACAFDVDRAEYSKFCLNENDMCSWLKWVDGAISVNQN